MCGVAIAKPGTPAGRVSKEPVIPTTNQPAGPAGGMSDTLAARAASEVHGGGTSMLSVSLDAIGVRSTGKTWGRILLISGALMALGAFGMWIAMHNEQDSTEETGAAEPDDPFMIGAPVPSGADTPDVDFVTGKTSGNTSTAPKDNSGQTAAATTKGSSRRTGSTRRSSGGVTGGSSGGGSTRSTSMGSSGSSSNGSTGSGSTGSSSMDTTGSGSTGTIPDPDPGTDELPPPSTGGSTDDPPERDIAMDLYSAKVRSVVRRYYAPRAQSCFSRATKNNPALHGTVVINMTVGATGQVTKTSVQRNSTGDSNLATCLKGQVKSWKLPPPPAGSLEMQLPFSR